MRAKIAAFGGVSCDALPPGGHFLHTAPFNYSVSDFQVNSGPHTLPVCFLRVTTIGDRLEREEEKSSDAMLKRLARLEEQVVT